jgi:hypothetical protein
MLTVIVCIEGSMRLKTLFHAIVPVTVVWCVSALPAFAGIPAGSTGLCNDGTYTKAAARQDACQGHQGVKTWFANKSSALSVDPDSNASAIRIADGPAPPKAPALSKTARAGGSPGLVWLDRSSALYYCYGTSYYGKTNIGVYVTEGAAKATGAVSDSGKSCSR